VRVPDRSPRSARASGAGDEPNPLIPFVPKPRTQRKQTRSFRAHISENQNREIVASAHSHYRPRRVLHTSYCTGIDRLVRFLCLRRGKLNLCYRALCSSPFPVSNKKIWRHRYPYRSFDDRERNRIAAHNNITCCTNVCGYPFKERVRARVCHCVRINLFACVRDIVPTKPRSERPSRIDYVLLLWRRNDPFVCIVIALSLWRTLRTVFARLLNIFRVAFKMCTCTWDRFRELHSVFNRGEKGNTILYDTVT
jgi:hypothetical protein